MPVNHLDFDLTKTFEQSSEENDVPERTGKIKKIHIVEKLESIGVTLDQVALGDFDQIGEFTAKKRRDPSSDLYKSVRDLIGNDKINYIPLSNREFLDYNRILIADIENSIQFSNNQGRNFNLIANEPFLFQANSDLGNHEINTGMCIYYANRVIWDTNNPNVIYIIPKQS